MARAVQQDKEEIKTSLRTRDESFSRGVYRSNWIRNRCVVGFRTWETPHVHVYGAIFYQPSSAEIFNGFRFKTNGDGNAPFPYFVSPRSPTIELIDPNEFERGFFAAEVHRETVPLVAVS